MLRQISLVAALAALSFGCDDEKERRRKSPVPKDTCGGTSLLCSLEEIKPEETIKDEEGEGKNDGSGPSNVDFAYYDREEHAIVAYFEYGGCEVAKQNFQLGVCATSSPQRCAATVTHDAFAFECDKLFQQEESFPVPDSLDDAIIEFSDKVQVTVDKDGSLNAPHTYKARGIVRAFEDDKCGPKFYVTAEGDDTFLLFDAELPQQIAKKGTQVSLVVTDRPLTVAEKANCEVGGAGMVGVHLERRLTE